MSAPRAPLGVRVIGAGRVGRTLGAALATAGHRVTYQPAASGAVDLFLLTVPDDALAGVAAGLTAEITAEITAGPGQVVAHTSGAHGLAVLAPATAGGARPLALHPAMTFTGQAGDVARLAGIGYGVTAPDDLRPFATRLVADLGGTVEWVAEPDRPLYHAALAHGANHLVTLVGDAADAARRAGVRDPARLLAPLLRTALENALRDGDAALTGPVARGDAGTVARHRQALATAAPGTLPAYQALARRTADRALAAGGLSPETAAALLAALAEPAAPAEQAEPERV